MSLADVVREKIKAASFGSTEKDILKVLLGELQRESSAKALTEDKEFALVRKLIKGNEETLSYLKDVENINYKKMTEENRVLSKLLPPTLDEYEIEEFVVANNIDLKSFKSDGQAVGEIMKQLKIQNLLADGTLVKDVVGKLRNG